MDFQDTKPAYQHVQIAQGESQRLEFQCVMRDLGKIDRLPILQGWMMGYPGELPRDNWHNIMPGQRATLARRSKKLLPNMYLYEHKSAPAAEWNLFNKLLSNRFLTDLKPEDVKQLPTILGKYATPSAEVGRMYLGGLSGYVAFKRKPNNEILTQAFFIPADPTHRIIEEVGIDFTGATEQERRDLKEMWIRINFKREPPAKDEVEGGFVN